MMKYIMLASSEEKVCDFLKVYPKQQSIMTAIFVVSLIAFAISASLFIRDYIALKKEAEAFDRLLESVSNEVDHTSTVSANRDEALAFEYADEGEVSNGEIPTAMQELRKKNSDIAAWLAIRGSNINYPVMLTPEDPEYYLRRDFDKNKSVSGVPFIGAGCDLESDNIIIYGHNMKNGTMFSDLTKYAEKDYRDAHPEISFETLADCGSYTVVAAFQTQVYRQDEVDVFRFYEYGGQLTKEQFESYIDHINAASLYDTEINIEYGDQLLTLSTCAYHTENGRFVVVAKKTDVCGG